MPSRSSSDAQIVTIDRDSAPRIVFCGEDLRCEDLPAGARVVYPLPPISGLPNPRAALRAALARPSAMDPLHALLRPGMKLTIAVDDVARPLPPMMRPDLRETFLDIALEMATDFGVGDVSVVVARGLRRRLHDWELRRMLGDRAVDALGSRLTQHDACDPELATEGALAFDRRVLDSDLLVHFAIAGAEPLAPLGPSLCSYESLTAERAEPGLLDRALAGRVPIFRVGAVLNNRAFAAPLAFLGKNEDEFAEANRLKLEALRFALGKTPRALRREVMMRVPAPFELIAACAGAPAEVDAQVTARAREQHRIEIDGACDVLVAGLPFVSASDVNARAMNPIQVEALAMDTVHAERPVVRRGGVLIVAHPCTDAFDAQQHPSHVEFMNRLLPETRDAARLTERYEAELAQNPSYVEMYRRGHAHHGAHPFALWRAGARARAHLGQIIVVGADNTTVPRLLGWERAASLAEAIAMARGTVGRSAQVTLLHAPPAFEAVSR